MYKHLTLILAAAVIAVPAASAKPTFTIDRDVNVGGFKRDARIRQAFAVFGAPSGRREEGFDRCTLTWRSHGVTMETFYPQGNRDPCGADAYHVSTTVKDRRWKTTAGLRIGDTISRMRTLYKRAARDSTSSWTLIPRNYFGLEFPGLSAKVANGRVVSLTVHGPRRAF